MFPLFLPNEVCYSFYEDCVLKQDTPHPPPNTHQVKAEYGWFSFTARKESSSTYFQGWSHLR